MFAEVDHDQRPECPSDDDRGRIGGPPDGPVDRRYRDARGNDGASDQVDNVSSAVPDEQAHRDHARARDRQQRCRHGLE